MRFCPSRSRPIDDIAGTLQTSIKGRVTEPASFVIALQLHVLSYERHKHIAFSLLLVADNRWKSVSHYFPLIIYSSLCSSFHGNWKKSRKLCKCSSLQPLSSWEMQNKFWPQSCPFFEQKQNNGLLESLPSWNFCDTTIFKNLPTVKDFRTWKS